MRILCYFYDFSTKTSEKNEKRLQNFIFWLTNNVKQILPGIFARIELGEFVEKICEQDFMRGQLFDAVVAEDN
jgi:hypothetical protein